MKNWEISLVLKVTSFYSQQKVFLRLDDNRIRFLDLLVAPVYLEGQRTQSVYLPADHWVYIWNGTEISVAPNSVGNGKYVEVYAEIGNPPVFYRKSSKWLNLFQDLKKCKYVEFRLKLYRVKL